MIPNYPYFGLPNYRRYMGPNMYVNSNCTHVQTQPQHSQSTIRNNNSNITQNINKPFNNKNIPRDISRNNYNNLKSNFQNNFNNNSNKNFQNNFNNNSQDYSPLFNILGFNLYFDDILLLCIIFFLYNEHVNEPYLFLTLVLLLLN